MFFYFIFTASFSTIYPLELIDLKLGRFWVWCCMASYPKLAGKPVPYLVEKLEAYRAGTRIGPNSDLMIMNAEPLTDDEIANLAAYLSSVKSN